MCNCNQTNPCNQTTNICGQTPCTPIQDCSCPVKDLSSDCVLYTGNDLDCSGISSGLSLTETLQLLDAYICDAISQISTTVNLINVGTGLEIYAGIDTLGKRKIRSLITTGNLLISAQNTDDITFSIDEEMLTIFVENLIPPTSVDLPTTVNVGTGEGFFKTLNTLTNENEFKTLKASSDIIKLTPTTDEVNIDVVNLQKSINSFPYTLTDDDDKYTIFIDNGALAVTINVPGGLLDNFSVVFIQKGSGDVTIQESSGGTLLYPNTLQNIIKGQFFWAMVEKEEATNDYYLLGSLKVV